MATQFELIKKLYDAGIEIVRVETITPDMITSGSSKVHVIEWSDKNNRSIKEINVKETDSNWINDKLTNELEYNCRKDLNENSEYIFKLQPGNKGIAISYKPFNTVEDMELSFYVTIMLEDGFQFSHAFRTFIHGGGGNNSGVGDSNGSIGKP
ncbi:MAG: hypothetical protein U0U67_16050 [Chitinophagales bacterium]